jgi:hypothetical protein
MSDAGKKRRTSRGNKLRFAQIAAALAVLLLGVMASSALADGDPFSALAAITGTSTSSDGTGASTDATTSTSPDTTGTSTDATTDTTSTDTGTTTDATAGTTTDSTTSSAATTTTTAALNPSITSDKADYQPGSTVTLTGSGWGPGEAVHLLVNDTIGQTWQYNADVTTDVSGAFTAQFSLPNTFISNYDVTATGAAGETATTPRASQGP